MNQQVNGLAIDPVASFHGSAMPTDNFVQLAAVNHGALPSEGPIRTGVSDGGSIRFAMGDDEPVRHGATTSVQIDREADRRAIGQATGSVLSTARGPRMSSPIDQNSTVCIPDGNGGTMTTSVAVATQLGYLVRTSTGWQDAVPAAAPAAAPAQAAAPVAAAPAAASDLPLLAETSEMIDGLRAALPAATFEAAVARAVSGVRDPLTISGLDSATALSVGEAVKAIKASLNMQASTWVGRYVENPSQLFAWAARENPVAARAAAREQFETQSARSWAPLVDEFLQRVGNGRKV